MKFAPSEAFLWTTDQAELPTRLDDRAINERYTRGEGRIVIETNREKLPGFVDQVKQPNYMDLRPFYQRRPRWDVARQSLLIESFIMNIPVPPVFLYERDYNQYEVNETELGFAISGKGKLGNRIMCFVGGEQRKAISGDDTVSEADSSDVLVLSAASDSD